MRGHHHGAAAAGDLLESCMMPRPDRGCRASTCRWSARATMLSYARRPKARRAFCSWPPDRPDQHLTDPLADFALVFPARVSRNRGSWRRCGRSAGNPETRCRFCAGGCRAVEPSQVEAATRPFAREQLHFGVQRFEQGVRPDAAEQINEFARRDAIHRRVPSPRWTIWIRTCCRCVRMINSRVFQSYDVFSLIEPLSGIFKDSQNIRSESSRRKIPPAGLGPVSERRLRMFCLMNQPFVFIK